MFENYKIKREIRRLKNAPISRQFLLSLRNKLTAHLDSGIVMKKGTERLTLQQEERSNFIILINKLKLMPIPLIIALIVALGGGGAVAASQNSLPGGILYPVKQITEDVRYTLTINPGSKAILQVEFAAERADEIKAILEGKDTNEKGLALALGHFKNNVAKAADVIEREKNKGKDVKDLAKEIRNKLDVSKDDIKRMLKGKDGEIENKLDEIENEHERIVSQLDAKEEAEKAISEAKEDKQEVIDEANEKNITISADSFKQYDDFIVKAQEAFDKSQYVQARQHARQAKDALKHVERDIEKAKDESEGENNDRNATTTPKEGQKENKENGNKGSND
ncbi:MAG: DUF5667 domain-containing protein [Candidatus Paceibacterota bacterium]